MCLLKKSHDYLILEKIPTYLHVQLSKCVKNIYFLFSNYMITYLNLHVDVILRNSPTSQWESDVQATQAV